jgi:peptide-methionine (S)-S-oxide reductase
MRQGGDIGTQYRSAIYYTSEEQRAAAASEMYYDALQRARHGSITTEIAPAGPFYSAEDYHH